jgi:transcriptional regulator with XRE-family HTH domain
MIRNDKQYQVTKSRLSDFRESLQVLEGQEIDPLLKELYLNTLKSQVIEFEKQIIEYEFLKEGTTNYVVVNDLSHIYEVLIKARIAKRLTQADLAKRLELKEQQIQRYEMSNYSTASISRIIEIANALDIRIEKFKVTVKEPEFTFSEGVTEKLFKYRMKRRHLLVA